MLWIIIFTMAVAMIGLVLVVEGVHTFANTYDDLNRLTSARHVQLVRGFTGLLQRIRLFFGRAL